MAQDSETAVSEIFVEYYSKIQCASTLGDLRAVFKEVVADFDFQNYSILYVGNPEDRDHRPRFIANHWSGEHTSERDRHGFYEKSSLIAKLRTQETPVTFDLETMTFGLKNNQKQSVQQQGVTNLQPRQNRLQGVYFPCIDSRGQKGAISVSGFRPLPSAQENSILHFICQFAFSHLHFLLAENNTRTELTRREEDCLSWSARGKTIAECSIILGISENTVASYLASTARKLSARNKAHMVAIAYERGLLNRHGDVMAV